MNMLTKIEIDDEVALADRAARQLARLKEFRAKFAALLESQVCLWNIIEQKDECGTVGCLAGWALMWYDKRPDATDRNKVGEHFRQYRQCELLDISKVYAKSMSVWSPAGGCVLDFNTHARTDRGYGLNRLDVLIDLSVKGKLPFCTEAAGEFYV